MDKHIVRGISTWDLNFVSYWFRQTRQRFQRFVASCQQDCTNSIGVVMVTTFGIAQKVWIMQYNRLIIHKKWLIKSNKPNTMTGYTKYTSWGKKTKTKHILPVSPHPFQLLGKEVWQWATWAELIMTWKAVNVTNEAIQAELLIVLIDYCTSVYLGHTFQWKSLLMGYLIVQNLS